MILTNFLSDLYGFLDVMVSPTLNPTRRTGVQIRKESNVNIMRALLRKAVAVSTFHSMLVLSLAVGHAPRCYAQTQTHPDTASKVAALHAPIPSDAGTTNSTVPAVAPNTEISPAIAREFAAMKAEIEALKAELRSRTQPAVVAGRAVAAGSMSAAEPGAKTADVLSSSAPADLSQEARTGPEKPKPSEPFAYADWTWLKRPVFVNSGYRSPLL